MQTSPQNIQSELRKLKAEQPKLRMRDIAQTLGISEAALVASACGQGSSTIRLNQDFAAQFATLGSLGRVMALTRNVCAVSEKIGVYGSVEHSAHASQVIGSDIDLRIFFQRFHVAFAVTSEGPHGPQRSLQFFDAHGDAVHKIHLLPESVVAAFDQLTARFASPDQSPHQPWTDTRSATDDRASQGADTGPSIDVEALRHAFSQLQDTHEFFGLLRRFQVRRIQALQLLGEEAARPVERLSLRSLLSATAESALPIMIFVGNPGMIQIHSGPVKTLKQYGSWFNVMDPDFNLHVHEAAIAQAFVVRKPTREGVVSSLELYDAAGESVLLAFSKRKHGHSESDEWRSILQRLPSLHRVESSVVQSVPGGVA